MEIDQPIIVDFSDGGNALNFLRAGWSHPEPDLTWMLGFDSTLVIARTVAWDRIFMLMEVMPHVRPDTLLVQRLVVAANNVIIGTFEFRDRSTLEVEIPRDVIGKRAQLTLRFLHPDAATPRAAAGLPDDRPLAIAVMRLVLSPTRQPPEERLGELAAQLDGI